MAALAQPDLTAASDAAVRFLDRARATAPLWDGFTTLAGSGTEWVSAFVLYSVRRHRPEPDPLVMRTLWRNQRPDGGWGYNVDVPPDCDSTAWVLLALGQRYLRPSAVFRAQSYLARHHDDTTGGFTTYARGDAIDRYIEVRPHLVVGWTSSHTCVTAVAVQALLLSGGARRHSGIIGRGIDYLMRAERNGTWTSYWWDGWTYPTYHALRTLALAGALTPALAARAERTLRLSQQPDGGWTDHGGSSEPFATAHAARALALVAPDTCLDPLRDAVGWLVRAQQPDGGWPTVPILRIPPPPEADPDQQTTWRVDDLGTGVRLRDESGVFTSAAAVACLLAVRCHLAGDRRGRGTVGRDDP